MVAQHPDLVTLKKSKDKLDNLKAKWNIWVKLRYEGSGWGWDETTQLFIASSEQWGRYIEVSSRCNIRNHALLLTIIYYQVFSVVVLAQTVASTRLYTSFVF